MIEFNGALTGSAEKYFFKIQIKIARLITLISLLMVIVGMAIIYYIFISLSGNIPESKILDMIIIFAVLFIAFAILTYTLLKKDMKKNLPKKIYIEDDLIFYISDAYTEGKTVGNVKEVHDYGEFYVMTFSAKNKASIFICQKDLLTKGTLEEFEALFEGKIVRIQSN